MYISWYEAGSKAKFGEILGVCPTQLGNYEEYTNFWDDVTSNSPGDFLLELYDGHDWKNELRRKRNNIYVKSPHFGLFSGTQPSIYLDMVSNQLGNGMVERLTPRMYKGEVRNLVGSNSHFLFSLWTKKDSSLPSELLWTHIL